MKKLTFKPITVAIAALCIAAGAGVALYSPASTAADEKDKNAVQKPALTVTTAKPQTSRLPIKLSANGNVAAWQEAVIGSESNGLRLTEVRVNVGDVVRAGQVLAVFSNDTINADVAQTRAAVLEAEANAAEAAANAGRARSLQATGAISAQQISQYLTAEQIGRAHV